MTRRVCDGVCVVRVCDVRVCDGVCVVRVCRGGGRVGGVLPTSIHHTLFTNGLANEVDHGRLLFTGPVYIYNE